MTRHQRAGLSPLSSERGFTLMELMVASVCTVIVLGGATALTSQIQQGYRRQIEDSAGEQEARYALAEISRYLRSSGNDPHGVGISDCATVNQAFEAIFPDPDEPTTKLTVQSDMNPPDGFIGGVSPDCNQAFEHLTISLNADNNTIEFVDNAAGANTTTRTDNVIDGLEFKYLESDGDDWTIGDSTTNIWYVRTTVRIRTRTIDPATGRPATRSLSSVTRVRSR